MARTTPQRAKKRGARRNQMQRDSGRSETFLRALEWFKELARFSLLAAVVLTLLLGSVSLYRYIDRPWAHISVASPFQRVAQSELESLVGDISSGGFLGLDLAVVRERLEAHPWIASASVRREWPDRLQLSVVEEVPIARWRDSGFLTRSGVALRATDNSELGNLPHLVGPEGSSREVMIEYRDVSELLFSQGLKVLAFRVDAHGARSFELATGHEVVLGRGDVIGKVRRFLNIWQGELASRQQQIKAIDARYDNGVAVSWQQSDVSG
ncbi:MAG: FtsQ-type POTRA domain-containing protein [Gammaproteobacteria bacterium]|nr:FtsQ-type POTRA domain-containing protein [Gammaproteobacteria bacterium]MBQ0838290.1 FtsQ-type POTRA domain-containing protein [Gammaproteobacteria bacterium]